MGFSMSQAQWLVQFMRNLPGGAPPQPAAGEYEQAMAAQQLQAAEQAQQAYYGEEAQPGAYAHEPYPGYEAPPFGYWHEGSPPESPEW